MDPEPLADLSSLGIARIDGMAMAPDSDDLWVVDSFTQQLFRLQDWRQETPEM